MNKKKILINFKILLLLKIQIQITQQQILQIQMIKELLYQI